MVSDELRKVRVTIRLPQWLVDRLKEEDNQSVLVERLLIKALKLKNPSEAL